eukprot:752040-Hanusia_phi.AAC.1
MSSSGKGNKQHSDDSVRYRVLRLSGEAELVQLSQLVDNPAVEYLKKNRAAKECNNTNPGHDVSICNYVHFSQPMSPAAKSNKNKATFCMVKRLSGQRISTSFNELVPTLAVNYLRSHPGAIGQECGNGDQHDISKCKFVHFKDAAIKPVEFTSSSLVYSETQRHVGLVVDGFSFLCIFESPDALVKLIECTEATLSERSKLLARVHPQAKFFFHPNPIDAMEKNVISQKEVIESMRRLNRVTSLGWRVINSNFKRTSNGQWMATIEDVRLASEASELCRSGQLAPVGANPANVTLTDLVIVTGDNDHLATLQARSNNELRWLVPLISDNHLMQRSAIVAAAEQLQRMIMFSQVSSDGERQSFQSRDREKKKRTSEVKSHEHNAQGAAEREKDDQQSNEKQEQQKEKQEQQKEKQGQQMEKQGQQKEKQGQQKEKQQKEKQKGNEEKEKEKVEQQPEKQKQQQQQQQQQPPKKDKQKEAQQNKDKEKKPDEKQCKAQEQKGSQDMKEKENKKDKQKDKDNDKEKPIANEKKVNPEMDNLEKESHQQQRSKNQGKCPVQKDDQQKLAKSKERKDLSEELGHKNQPKTHHEQGCKEGQQNERKMKQGCQPNDSNKLPPGKFFYLKRQTGTVEKQLLSVMKKTIGKKNAIAGIHATETRALLECRFYPKCSKGQMCKCAHIKENILAKKAVSLTAASSESEDSSDDDSKSVCSESSAVVIPKGFIGVDDEILPEDEFVDNAGKQRAIKENGRRGRFCTSTPCRYGAMCLFLHRRLDEGTSSFISQLQKLVLEQIQAAAATSIQPVTADVECHSCMEQVDPAEAYQCSEGHVMCHECFNQFIRITWAEQKVEASDLEPQLRCAVPGCSSTPLKDTEVARHATEEAMTKYFAIKQQWRDAKTYAHAQSLLQREQQAHGSSFAGEAGRALLQEQLKMEMPNALMCPRCKCGPIDHFSCSDLTTHDGHNVEGGARIDNSCPNCRFFANDVSEWDRWDGVLRRPEDLVASSISPEDLQIMEFVCSACGCSKERARQVIANARRVLPKEATRHEVMSSALDLVICSERLAKMTSAS